MLQSYEERFDYLIAGGSRVLLPGDWELAAQRAAVARLGERLEDLTALAGDDPDKQGELRDLKLALRTQGRALEHLERLAAAEGDRETEVYLLRPFTHRERLAADDEYTAIDAEKRERTMDGAAINARNLALVKLVLQGRKVGTDLVPIGDPYELPDGVYQALVGRMWARNSLAEDLVLYFRRSGEAARA